MAPAAPANTSNTGAGGTALLDASSSCPLFSLKNRTANRHTYSALHARFTTFAHTRPASPKCVPSARPTATPTKPSENATSHRLCVWRSTGAAADAKNASRTRHGRDVVHVRAEDRWRGRMEVLWGENERECEREVRREEGEMREEEQKCKEHIRGGAQGRRVLFGAGETL